MKHFHPFQARDILTLPIAEHDGWRIKRYAILAKNRKFDEKIASAALDAAKKRLPKAGKLDDPDNNHGVGFQIIHFAEVAVVSPLFYWMWGSVLANTKQMRAQWETPTIFEDGISEVVGCVWELEIITFEIQSWMNAMLCRTEPPQQEIKQYLNSFFPTDRSKQLRNEHADSLQE